MRALKDRNELYVDGEDIIQFGKNKFNVNTQELELSIIQQEKEMCFHLSGTDYFEPIKDEDAENLMLEALLQDRVDFVALLLDCSYVNLARFMKPSILQFWLYYSFFLTNSVSFGNCG